MDLMTLAAKIVLDDSSYKSGVSSAEKAGSGLANKMSAMTVAVGNLAADMIKTGFGAIKNVMGEAISSYGNYEQLIGGVETLFKTSSDKVAAYAKRSYKTTGLSANNYMETVTSFSASLLQGLKGDTEAAADMADMAITDMADNANKMGTDISSIQAAYQGFAKQNYTMLDNLKLGYGGTASEMVRLINDSGTLNKKIKNLDNITFDQIVTAIHAVQDQMGITGTTSEEAASTLEGSKNAMKAAWEDLLSAIGGEGDKKRLDEAMEAFKTSLSTYMENFIPTLSETIANSGTLVNAIADGLSSLPTTLLSEIGENAVEAGTDMVSGIGKVTDWMLQSIIELFKSASLDNSSITELGAAIGELIGSSIGTIVTNAGTIFEGIVAVGTGLASGLVQGLVDGLTGEDSEVSKITDALNTALTETDVESTKATAIIQYLTNLQTQYGNAATNTAAWKDAINELNGVLPGAGEAIAGYLENIPGAMETLGDAQKLLAQLATLETKYGRGAKNTKEWKEAIAELDKVLPGSKEAIESYATDVETTLSTLTQSQELITQLQSIAELYGEGATETSQWKEAVEALNQILPGAGEVFSQYGADVQGAINKLDELIKKQRETTIMTALNNASAEQTALLTEQTLARNTAQRTYERNADLQGTYLDNIRQAIMTAAQTQAEAYREQAEHFGGFDENSATYVDLMNLAKGLTNADGVGDSLQSIADLDFSGLKGIVESFTDSDLQADLLEVFNTNEGLFSEAQAAMDRSSAEIDRLNAEIEATNSAIADTNAVMAQTAQELLGSGTDASDAIKTGGAMAEAALESFAARVGSIRIGPRNGASYTPEATGIDDVPYNGFRAELHKGEMVMTAHEARNYRNGGGTSEIVGAVEGLRNDIQNIQLVVGQKALGAAVVDYGGSRMRGYIGQAERRMLKGYGR